MHTREEKMEAFGRFLDVLDELREKCPWDRKQTNESLRPNTIEETYELCDALIKNDAPNVCKELGDVLLHIGFYARFGEETGDFDMADVCNKLTDKLIYRHPHIYHPSQIGQPHPKPLPYGTEDSNPLKLSTMSKSSTETIASNQPLTATQVLDNWEQLKLKEKDGNKRVLSGVPSALPSLIKAYRIQDKAAHVGFDWEQREDVWAKVHEEVDELRAELEKADKDAAEKELGDFIFSIVNAARLYKLNPDNALDKTNAKFIRRFNHIEDRCREQGRDIKDLTLQEMDELWNEAKMEANQ